MGRAVKYLGAAVCVILVVISFVAMGEALQTILKIYPQPYFLVYWVHSWFSISYIVWAALRYFPGNCCNKEGDGAVTMKRAWLSSGIIGAPFLLISYFWYLSLHRTSVPANAAICQSEIALVFIVSLFILKESVTILKVVSTVICIGGVVIVALYSETDKSSPVPQSALGYIYLSISVLLQSFAEVLYKKICTVKDDPAAAMNSLRVFGLSGVHTLLWMWPPIIVLHYTGLETFHWPSPDVAKEVLKLMFFSAALHTVLNCAFYTGISFSSPLFMSIGQALTVPVSIVTDFIIYHKAAMYIVYIGMVLIIVGFLGFCVSEFVHARREEREKAADNAMIPPGDTDIQSDGVIINDEKSLLLTSSTTTWHKYMKYIL